MFFTPVLCNDIVLPCEESVVLWEVPCVLTVVVLCVVVVLWEVPVGLTVVVVLFVVVAVSGNGVGTVFISVMLYTAPPNTHWYILPDV